MRVRIFLPVAALLVLAALAALLLRPGSASTPGGQVAPVVGRAAPDISLSDTSGKTISLAGQRGHIVLLNFWATWCIPCRSEMPQIEKLYASHRSDLTVLGIDKQEPRGDVVAFAHDHHVTFPLLLDPSLTAWNAYRVTLQPVSFWIDRQGTIRSIHYGAMDAATMRHNLNRLLG